MTRNNGFNCIGCGLVRCGCRRTPEWFLRNVPPQDINIKPGEWGRSSIQAFIDSRERERDNTARPDVPHYTRSHIEPLDVIRAWGLGFELGNVIKYVARCDHKADPIADLKKARDYIDLELERRLSEE